MVSLTRNETFVLVTSYIIARHAKYKPTDAYEHANKVLGNYINGTENADYYCCDNDIVSTGNSAGGR